MKSLTNLFILFFILIVLGFLYKRFEDKRIREEEGNTNNAIQKYLLDDITLGKSKKPILWLHVPYEYNSRNWLSFGSRSSFDLNQPYLYLTVRSIIKKCEESFTICIIDDSSFQRLIPNWNINMEKVSDPILSNLRLLGISKLIYTYGGIVCPISFICLKNLEGLYEKGINNGKMFICQVVDKNISSSEYNYFPSLIFWGAPKGCETVRELCNVVQHTTSNNYSADVKFLGEFNKWCNYKIEKRQINLIDGIEIGVKTMEGKQILIDNLISNYYLHISPEAYGIYIPSDEILNRRNFQWFARLSQKQVLESDTIMGNYMLLVTAPGKNTILEPLNEGINKEVTNKFVGFWKTPLYPGLWMVSQPNMLGDNIPRVKYTGR
jgi:hypothetical protein